MTMPEQKPWRSKQDYATPWSFVRAYEARWGSFDVDLAATSRNAKAQRFFSPKQDSLRIPWATHFGRSVLAWLNPPFERIEPWAEKCAAEAIAASAALGLRIVMLTPASVSSDWFAEHVHGRAFVLGVRPRLTFEGELDPYPKDLMLSLFGFGSSGFDVWRWAPDPVRRGASSSARR